MYFDSYQCTEQDTDIVHWTGYMLMGDFIQTYGSCASAQQTTAIKQSQLTWNIQGERMKRILLISLVVLVLDAALVHEKQSSIFATRKEHKAFFHLFKVQCECKVRKKPSYFMDSLYTFPRCGLFLRVKGQMAIHSSYAASES